MKVVIVFIIMVVSVDITGCYTASMSPDLGNGYKLKRYNKLLQIENSQNTVIVGGHILNYAFDATFIIVSQRPIDSVSGIETMKYEDYWEAFDKSSFKQYWIINKRMESEYSLDQTSMSARYSNVYGPYKKQDYLQKREELKVSKKLHLKSGEITE